MCIHQRFVHEDIVEHVVVGEVQQNKLTDGAFKRTHHITTNAPLKHIAQYITITTQHTTNPPRPHPHLQTPIGHQVTHIDPKGFRETVEDRESHYHGICVHERKLIDRDLHLGAVCYD